ncbi:MAG: hypothetical protein H9893_01095 [Candidatus Niameybacter stercoravium]|nr:hypothetical protein [Candidatus Niameybacter stercoravium]
MDSLIGIIIEIGLLVICLVTAIKVTKREDTTIPLIDELADKTLGIIPMQSNHE